MSIGHSKANKCQNYKFIKGVKLFIDKLKMQRDIDKLKIIKG